MNIVTLNSRKNEYLQSQYICHNLFTPEECQQIIIMKGKAALSPVQLPEGKKEEITQNYNPKHRNSVSKFIELNEVNKWFFDRVVQAVNQVNKDYFRFIIDLFTEAQVLKYEAGGFFNWHVDIGRNEVSTRKLSVVILLSEPNVDFEGGDLNFYLQNPPNLNLTKGSMVIFPSYIPHVVNQVTKGTRFSMVGWFHGPHFR